MENEAVETIKHRGLTIDIFRDFDAPSPTEMGDDSLAFLVHYHRDFEITKDKIITKDELIDWVNGEKIETEKDYHIFLTKAYIHSGIVLALEESGRIFPDERWDVSRCGAVLVNKKETTTRKRAYQLAEGLIKQWNDCLSGNVYGYVIRETNESCWGFYGDVEKSGIIEEAKASIDFTIKNEPEEYEGIILRSKIVTREPIDWNIFSEILIKLSKNKDNTMSRHAKGLINSLKL